IPFQPPPEVRPQLYVDAISGKDGRPLWWWRTEVALQFLNGIGSPFWWSRGPDGWPLLGLPLEPALGFRAAGPAIMQPRVVHLIGASTGREVTKVTGLTKPALADLNSDGLDDLYGEVEGELGAFRGEGPEAWRVLGTYRPPDENFDSISALGRRAVDLDG